MNKKYALVLVCCGVLFAGCLPGQQSATTSTPSTDYPASTTVKQGDTTRTGKLTKIGEKFFLQETGKQAAEIDSYAVDLNMYVDQTVTVTGQYSGDTLFVGSVN